MKKIYLPLLLQLTSFVMIIRKINLCLYRRNLLLLSLLCFLSVKGLAQAGIPATLVINIQPTSPSVNGGLLGTQPIVTVTDQFGNPVPAGINITADVTSSQNADWSLGGTITVTTDINGVATFTDLTASNGTLITYSGASIDFIPSSGTGTVTSTPGFSIPTGSLAADFFRSNVSAGAWSAVSSWQSSHDASTYTAATLVPDSSASSVFIQTGQTISLNSSIKVSNTVVSGTLDVVTGGVLNIKSGGFSTFDEITIPTGGVLKLSASNSNPYASIIKPDSSAGAKTAGITIDTGGKILVTGNGTSVPAGSIGFATDLVNQWADGSIFEWNGPAAIAVGLTGGVICFPNVGAAVRPFFRFTSASTIAVGSSFTINGITDINNSTVSCGNGGTKNFRDGFTGTNGILTLVSGNGTMNITSATAILGGTLSITMNHALVLTNGITIPVGADIKLSAGATPNFTKTNGTFLVNGTIDMAARTVTNASGSVVINGTLKTANANGLGFTPIGTLTLNTGSTIEYNSSGAQNITSTSFLSGQSYYNISFSGGGTKTLSGGPAAVNTNGTISITGSSTKVVDSNNNIGSSGANNIALTMNGGRLVLSTTGTQPSMNGLYTLTAGVIEFAGANQTINNKAYQNIDVTGASVSNSNRNIVLNSGGIFTVKTGGNFSINDSTISGPSGSQTVAVEPGGVFNCGNIEGFHGFPATTSRSSSLDSTIELINLQSGSIVNYSRAVPAQPNDNQNITTTFPYYTLGLGGTGTKTQNPNTVLTVLGNLTSTLTDTFAHNGGTVLLNGLDQNFAGLPFNNLLLDGIGTKTLTNSGSVEDSLQISSLAAPGATVLALSNNYLSLKSTPIKTARVGSIPDEADITYGTGRFVIEKYFAARRAWRLITAPVRGETGISIFSSWQKNGASSVGEGMFISGKNPSTANGLDATPQNNYSLKTWNTAVAGFNNISNTKLALLSNNAGTAGIPDNIGYFTFVRGDRSTSNLFYVGNSTNTVLRDTGKIQVKAQTITYNGPVPTDTTGFELVGNPYASQMDINRVMPNTTNIDQSKFYIYDPYLNSDIGGYRVFVYDSTSGQYESAFTQPVNGLNTNIQSCQAFFVQRTAASATVSFDESVKTIDPIVGVFRPAGTVAPSFRTSLYLTEATGNILADGIYARYSDGYNNNLDKYDVLKFSNIKESFSLKRNGRLLAVESRELVKDNDTLFFNLVNITARNYRFEFLPANLGPLLSAWVEDSYLNKRIVLNLSLNTGFDFTVNADSASFTPDRFRIIFKAAAAGPLPVTFTSVTAANQGKAIKINWTVASEINIQHYDVEKSIDGLHFKKVNTTKAVGGAGNLQYQWIDESPVAGYNFYRIKSTGAAGEFSYSQIVKAKENATERSMVIYPNPVRNGEIKVRFNNYAKGVYQLRLINALGEAIQLKVLNYDGGSSVYSFKVKNHLINGTYSLEVISPDKSANILKVIAE